MTVEPFVEPAFVAHRLAVWERLSAAKAAEARVKREIVVALPDGNTKEGTAWETTPMEIAKSISNGLAQKAVAAKVNGAMWDLNRPLEGDCDIQIITFDSEEGKHVFWHSSAHVLGEALEYRFNAKLAVGPPLEDGGFFYDISCGEAKVSQSDYKGLNEFVKKIMKERQPFERLVLTKEEALEMFKYNPLKVELITQKIPDNEVTTAYRCGPLIDLCRGPHIPHTGVIKAFEITKNSGAYWKGDADREYLQRVYGISFPDKKKMKEYLKFQELAALRDHRRIGEEQHLFFFDQLSPGSCFFLPHGTRIYNRLMELIRGEYVKRGFEEVITPNVYNTDLFATSGHLENYKENMFMFQCEKADYALKPMNCPGHCILYKHRLRSSRELPMRFADFGVLHRNEKSGALSGLTRVRRFQQDDAHIFCTQEQIEEEVFSCLDFLKHIYGIFGFKFSLALSTKPAKALGGNDALWDQAESALERVLNTFGQPWKINPGDGAFYGPKIDVEVTDALRRKHQCATIQLDFQLPLRFGLKYSNADGDFPPVIIHRAVLGSVERFMAVLTEHIGGKWPFWLSPRQVMIVPISLSFAEYASHVHQRLKEAGMYVDVDLTKAQLKKKIAKAQVAQYNYILVVGAEEQETKTVNVRTRDNKTHGTVSIDDMIQRFAALCETYEMDPDLDLLSHE